MELNTGKKARVIAAMRQAKQHLFNYQVLHKLICLTVSWCFLFSYQHWLWIQMLLKLVNSLGLCWRIPSDWRSRSHWTSSLSVLVERHYHAQGICRRRLWKLRGHFNSGARLQSRLSRDLYKYLTRIVNLSFSFFSGRENWKTPQNLSVFWKDDSLLS